MHKAIATTIYFILAGLPSSWAQEHEVDHGAYDTRIGKAAYIFAENAKIYDDPSIKAKVLSSMAVGEQVQVEAQMKALSTENGFKDAWFKVNLPKKSITGYLWGGSLALASLDLGEGHVFLAGITGMQDPKDQGSYKKLAQAKVMKAEKVIAIDEFQPIDMVLQGNRYQYTVTAKSQKLKKASPKSEVVVLNFSYEACDYPNGDILFVWNNGKLTKGPQVIVTNSVDYAHSSTYSYVWPTDKGGKDNCIKVEHKSISREAKSADEASQTSWNYSWDGKALKKSDRCD